MGHGDNGEWNVSVMYISTAYPTVHPVTILPTKRAANFRPVTWIMTPTTWKTAAT